MKYLLYLCSIILLFSGCKSSDGPLQIGTFEAQDPAFWDVVSRNAVAERIGINFEFTEGPVWHPDGYLLFSDIPASTIYQWEGKKYVPFRKPSGKSNGLLVDPARALIACEHESRSITRMSSTGDMQVLADNYQGLRFNSPNDLCRRGDGSYFFTDPPWGLEGRNEDPEKDLRFNGVFRLQNGEVRLVDSTLSWPNGIALSPDDRYLYVANFEPAEQSASGEREVFWMRYELDKEGQVLQRERFFEASDLNLPGGPDGMKVDKKGNLFATGPGGILVISPQGKHLGTIGLPEVPANVAFGPRERVLYATARSMIVRIYLDDRPLK